MSEEMSRETEIRPCKLPSSSRSGATDTSHQRGSPLAVGQKAWNRLLLPSRALAMALWISGCASSGHRSHQFLPATIAKSSMPIAQRPLRFMKSRVPFGPDDLDAIGALVEDRRQHVVRRASKAADNGWKVEPAHILIPMAMDRFAIGPFVGSSNAPRRDSGGSAAGSGPRRGRRRPCCSVRPRCRC